MSELVRYKDWAPTQFDPKGAFLADRMEWVVVPVIRTRDSGPLEESNFAAALKILGGEQEDLVEVHRFGHWANGWFEIILAHPSLEDKVQEIQRCLENYPVLDESDHCRREEDDYQESWDSWGYRDFVRALVQHFGLGWTVRDFLQDLDSDILQEFWESFAPERYYSESSGVCIPFGRGVQECTRETLAEFLRTQRNPKKEVEGGLHDQA